MLAKLTKEVDFFFFFIVMSSLDTEMPQLLHSHCKLAMVSDMQINDSFD